MRILAVSDLRVQSLRLLEQVADHVNPDLIVYGGDDVVRFGAGPHSWSPLAQRTRFGLAGVIGNDCLRHHAAALAQLGCHDLDQGPLLLDGLAVIGLGGAPSDEASAIGYTLYTREHARERLHRHLSMVGDRAVLLVSHTPPRGILDIAIRFGVDHIGSSAVRDILNRPEVRGVVCGHVHSQGGRQERVGDALVVNVASHDHPGAALVYAILDWDARSFRGQLHSRHEAQTIRDVQGVGEMLVPKLRNAGFSTPSDLLVGDGSDLAAVVGAAGTARRIRAAARALTTGVPVLLAPAEPFPSSAVIVDVETSVDRLDDPWLVAFRAVGEDQVHQIQELDPKRHREHLGQVDKALGAFSGSRLIQWGTFDRSALERAYRAVELPPPAWLAADVWFDACAWMKRVLALPVTSSGLKCVGDHLGYPFAHPELDGLLVGQWYAMHRTSGAAFDVQRVRAYNRDDVAAAEHVVRAVQALALRSDLFIEPPVPAPQKGAVTPVAPAVVRRAVAGYRASLDARVASGNLTSVQRDNAVAKYEASMLALHGGAKT